MVDFLQDLTDVNIVTDQKALEAEGITDETTVNLKLSNVRLESALNLILEQVNLDYVIKDEAIFITNKAGVGKDPELRVYDVRDLVVAMGGHGEEAKPFTSPLAPKEREAVAPDRRPAAIEIDVPQIGQVFKFERFLVCEEPLYIEAPYVRKKD